MAFVTRVVLANGHMSDQSPHCLQLFKNKSNLGFFERVINWLYRIPKLWDVIGFIILINRSELKLLSSHKYLLTRVMTGALCCLVLRIESYLRRLMR